MIKNLYSTKMEKLDKSESEYLHQTISSHFKFIINYLDNLLNLNNLSSFYLNIDYLESIIMRPSIFILLILLILLIILSQTIDFWLNILYNKFPFKILTRHLLKTNFKRTNLKNVVYELKANQIGIYAIQGRRLHMEDRFSFKFDNLNGECQLNGKKLENLKKSNKLNQTYNFEIVSIYDGHGGVTASNFCKDNLLNSIKKSFDELIVENNLNHCNKELNLETISKLITEQILKLDSTLCNMLKNSGDIAGTTAIIVLRIVETNQLIVVNIGDSRAILCDGKGNSIPLSFDHKPHHPIEFRRIYDNGGFVKWNGVWRVAGILACSRALGDFPLKEKNFVVATPDILTFNLNELKPKFIILASDGLFDFFSNEDAIKFVKNKMEELLSKRFALTKNELSLELAKSLTLEAYKKGSSDNITVVVWVFNYDIIDNNESTNKKIIKQPTIKEMKTKKAEELEETQIKNTCRSRFERKLIADNKFAKEINYKVEIKSSDIFSEFKFYDLAKKEHCSIDKEKENNLIKQDDKDKKSITNDESSIKKKKCKKEDKKNKFNLNLELMNLDHNNEIQNKDLNLEKEEEEEEEKSIKKNELQELDNNANSIRLKDEYNLIKSPKKLKTTNQFKIDNEDEFYDCK